MAQTRKPKKRNPMQAVLLIALVLVVVVILALSLGKNKKSTAEEAAVQNGLNFLSQQEQKSPEPVRQARQALYERRMEEQKDELLEELSTGEKDPFSLFQDYAVLGDSRAVGFYFWDFLPENRVLAESGNTILAIPDRYETLKELQPSYVYLCYGLNDCFLGIWETGEEYAADYVETVKELQTILPEATIVVSSILPAKDPAFEQSENWRALPDWNVALKNACGEAGILFADCDWLYEEHGDLWDVDGIHFTVPLYPYWASELIVTALYGGMTNEI